MKYCETENTNSAAGTRSNGSRSGGDGCVFDGDGSRSVGDGCIIVMVMVVGLMVMVV